MTIRLAGLCLAALLGAGCAARPVVTIAPEPTSHAWWLRARFDPRGTALDGIPVRSVNAGWCAVDAFTPAGFEAAERADGRDPRAADAPRYAVPGPEVEGEATRLHLVAFRDCAGSTGTAMVLLAAPGASARRVIAVDVLSTPAAYAMLDSDAPGHVRVVYCQDCGVFDEYSWDAVGRRWIAIDDPAAGER